MTGARLRVLQLVAVAAAGSQAGHLLAYQARFAGSAVAVESTGAHGYFLPALTWVGGVTGAIALASLLLIAGARRLGGRRTAAWRALDVLPLLFALQLALYAGQESIESLAAGAAPPPAVDLLLWGGLGQLPVACAGALALAWISGRVESAVAAFDSRLAQLRAEIAPLLAVQLGPPTAAAPAIASDAGRSLLKRGPPPSS